MRCIICDKLTGKEDIEVCKPHLNMLSRGYIAFISDSSYILVKKDLISKETKEKIGAEMVVKVPDRLIDEIEKRALEEKEI